MGRKLGTYCTINFPVELVVFLFTRGSALEGFSRTVLNGSCAVARR